MENNGRRYRGAAAILNWFRSRREPETPAAPLPRPAVDARDYTIRVLESDLYNPSINLIEHVIWDEAQFHETISSPPQSPEPEKKRSGFVDLLLEQTSGLGLKLGALAGRVEAGEAARAEQGRKVRAALDEIERLKRATAEPRPEPLDRRTIDELLARVEEIRLSYAGRAELQGVSAGLDQLKDRAAEQEAVAELADRIERIRDEFAGRDRVDALARELDELRAGATDRGEIEGLAARIEEVKAGLIGPGRVDELAAAVEEIKAAYAGRGELEKIGAELKELRAKYTGRALLDKVHDHLEVAGTRFAERTQLSDALDRIAEIAAKYADRETLGSVAAAVEEIKANYAERARLDELMGRVEEIARRYADRESVVKIKAELKDLSAAAAPRGQVEEAAARIEQIAAKYADRESLAAVNDEVKAIGAAYAERGEVEKAIGRIEEIAAKYADREALAAVSAEVKEIREAYAGRAELDGVRAKVEEVRAGAAERGDLDRVAASVEALRAMLEETRRTQGSLMERPEAAVAPGPPAAAAPTMLPEGIAERIAGLERGRGELNELAARSLLVTDLESRVSGLERELRSALAAAAEKEAAARPSMPELTAALARMAEIERRHDELGRKVVEALKKAAAPSVETEGLRRKLSALELALKRLPPAPRPRMRPFPALTGPRLILVLAVVFLAALAVGTVAAFWSSDPNGKGWSIRGRQAGAEAPADAPNAIYDDVKPPLTTPTLDMGAEWLTLKDGKVDITGYSPGAVRAFLYLDNRELMGTTVESQGFKFSQVPLAYGVNVIEVKVKDEEGNEANSMAGIVERASASMAKVRADSVLNRQRGPRELPCIALTIDAGASNQRAEKILNVLRDKGIITTFFLTGQFIEKYPEIVKRIVADGHEVGNHSHNHPHLTTFEQNRRHLTAAGVTRELVQGQLLKTKELFENLTGAHMAPYWRAPYGEYNSDILAWANEAGFKHVDWTRTPQNLDMLDWIASDHDRHYLDGQGLLRRLTGIDAGVPGQANGGIILMHLGSDRHRDFMDEILPQAIDTLRSKNYRFVTISRMFSRQ
ncbi:MAG TPA: polysaccharide deacetylase family protein [bacterium]|nr:polysaccharide deacetylase family protein [bacterium]